MKLFHEPLLHFVVAGTVLFAAFAWLGDSEEQTKSIEPVRVGDGELKWLTETFKGQWQRPPDGQELQALITELIKEELFAREAREMGLEEHDTIVRRRLAQKLEFLLKDTAKVVEPTVADLRKYYEANLDLFRVASKASFRQVYFNPDGRKDAAADAADMLERLQAGDAGDVAELGDRFLLGTEFKNLGEQEATGMLGEELSREIYAARTGSWAGPFKSGYGYHLINVSERNEQGSRPFEEAREAVSAEWLRDRQDEVSRDYIARLREKYGVVYGDEVAKLLSPGPKADVASR
ncbi:peptidylprolyl isomerase [Mesorhizobium onobrychidis]|uniref:Parvulin-like PPIase n=1 Tax=Mesorhizobium onobrychidis TaxID=2775404 RepID=A0ABY5QUQ8_9HYPH|nr:peptidylprolyl isomerase [Mesorhizobium onobrychidis]UVC14437.1 peptidyl-prolyl cis-trans isomerase [Mesorhizobium onobrychidis]